MTTLSKQEKQVLEKEGYDLEFVEEVQPEGGIHFPERFTETGDGFTACLHVYQFAEEVNSLWLAAMMNIPGTIATLDTATADKSEVIRNINRSMNELLDRAGKERHQTDRNDAISEIADLENFAKELSQQGEVVKLVHLRIYVYHTSQAELEKTVGDIKKDLENRKHKLTILQFRQKYEWLSLFTSYDKQMDMGNVVKGFQSGVVTPASSLGGGIPFHHQSLKDPRGTYLGVTSTQGAFILDVFNSTTTRKSFNGFVLGKMGFGKSTILKQLEEGLVAKDTFIRGFDKARDFYKLIQTQNGRIVDLAGAGGEMINPLEIFATATDEKGFNVNEVGSFLQHLAKVTTMFRFLYPELSNRSITEFRAYLRNFYVDYGLVPKNFGHRSSTADVQVTGLDPEEYPTLGNFLQYLQDYKLTNPTTEARQVLERLVVYVREMVEQYGALFDGHTTMTNLEKEPILFFDIDTLSQLDREVFQCQLFSALTIIWSHGLKNGRKQKTLKEQGKIDMDDWQHFMVFIDECHNIINADNLMAVKYVTDFQREMRKFRAGVFFATQSPAEVLPESANNKAIDEVKKVFSFCQYKLLLNLDNSMMGTMRDVLGDTITETEMMSLTRLKQGEALVQVAPNETYTVSFTPTDQQLERFAGGA